MKKLLLTALKAIIFFVGWAILASILPIPQSDDPAIWRFWAELIPFLSIVVFTVIFWLIEKGKVPLRLVTSPLPNALIGIATGIVWLGLSVLLLIIMGVLHFDGYTKVSLLGLWLFSALINTVMQELLVRGYLYQMIKSNYNLIAATVVSTALFTLAHGGAFEAGLIPVLNVLTMSLFMTVVLEFTHSLLAPIIIHFLWNSIGAIILGGVSLAEDYPHLLNMYFTGNTFLSGGTCKIEGSIIVLILNILFTIGFMVAAKKRGHTVNQ